MDIRIIFDRLSGRRSALMVATGLFMAVGVLATGIVLFGSSAPAPETMELAAAQPEPATPATPPPAPVQASPNTLPAPMFPASVNLQVGEGDTLISILTDTGVSYDEAEAAVIALRKVYDPRRLDIGQKVAVSLDASVLDPHVPTLTSLSMPISKTAMVELKRSHNGAFHARTVQEPLIKKLVHATGRITNSFYQTGLRVGVPANTLADLIKIYSYDVDFQRDIKRGNRLDVMMERLQTKDGTVAAYGNMVYASLEVGKRTIAVYRYQDRAGNVDYYNEKGESLRKALLRTPINGARITSGFGMRMHPILGYSRMHRGVDFGAPTGTPIYAAGDGVVQIAGWHAGYGNYVRIKHDAKYSTAYGHASRIAKGIHPGVHVKQGQVIAYVGATGLATGPHLHYEVLVNGEQVNPAGVKFKTGNSLAGKDLKAFRRQVEQVRLAMGDSLKSSQYADAR